MEKRSGAMIGPMPTSEDRRSDAELLRQASRDPEAFAAFYRRHAGWVERVVARRCGDRELAADVTAETFAAVFAARDRFDPQRGSAGSWLLQIALNKLADAQRRGVAERRTQARAAQATEVGRDEVERVEELASLPGDGDAGPLLATLPDEQRRAVEARVVDERGYDEIATEMGLSQAAVRQRVSRGLTTLRTRLRRAGAVPVAVGALLALGGAAAATTLSGDRARERAPEPAPALPAPATPALPRQCDEAERRFGAQLTGDPVDAAFRDDFALLRRPQRPSDRADCPAAGSGHVNPGAIRRLAVEADGSWYLVPQWAPMTASDGRRDPILCVVWLAPPTRRYATSARCRTPGQLRDGRFAPLTFGSRSRGGLVPDGVAEVELRMRSGRRERFPVSANAWRYRPATERAAAADPLVEVRFLDGRGAIVRTFRENLDVTPPR